MVSHNCTDPDSASLQLQRPGVSTAGAAMCKQASAMQPAAPRSVARGCLSLIIFLNIKFKYHCITLIFLFQHHMCRLAAGRDPPRIGAARSVRASGRSTYYEHVCEM